MRTLVIVLAALALCLCSASAKVELARPAADPLEPGRSRDVIWCDDIEGDVSQWTTVDFTAVGSPHFHVDTYMAYEGTHSWWCGNFDYDTDGGYGNSWDDRLVIPTTDLSLATYPILTFAFRHDSEIGHDYTYVQACSMGTFVNLNRGYDGKWPWEDLGVFGFALEPYGSPLQARFRFLSDGAWSDEDGDYLSVGGAFMCDIVKVFDYFGGYVYFYDDADADVHMVPSIPGAAGDYWHVIENEDAALSDPHCWWCGDDCTELVPPNLQNGLYTPVMDVACATACTVRFAAHLAIATVDNDFCTYEGTCDGGTYYTFAAVWGDMGLTGWDTGAYNTGFDVGQFCRSLMSIGFGWVMHTTDNGCGPSSAGLPGIMIDDVCFFCDVCSPAEAASWGRIKAMYR